MTANDTRVKATKIDLVVTPIFIDPTQRSQKFIELQGLFEKNALESAYLPYQETEYFVHTVKHHTPQGAHLNYHMVKQADYLVMADLLGLIRGTLEQMKADQYQRGYTQAIHDVVAGRVDFGKY